MPNKFFKISTDSDSPSEAEPSCAFSSKSLKKGQSYGQFCPKNLKKSIFGRTVEKNFKISTDSDSPSEYGSSCPFSSKSVKK